MKYDKGELIEHLREAEDEIVPLTSGAFDEHPDYPAKSTVKRHFGSWSRACEIAGVESGQVTRKNILYNIEQLYQSGEIENSEDFFQHPETISAATFYKNFDCWREAVDEIGIEAYAHYTGQDILQHLKKFEQEFGYVSKRKFKYEDGYPSSNTVSRMFGTWNKAVREAGIEPNRVGVCPNEAKSGKTRQLFGSNWGQQREKALERDNFKCRNCGSETELHVHHTKPRYTYRESDVFEIEQANELHNLVTLCKDCHYSAHNGNRVPTNVQKSLAPRVV